MHRPTATTAPHRKRPVVRRENPVACCWRRHGTSSRRRASAGRPLGKSPNAPTSPKPSCSAISDRRWGSFARPSSCPSSSSSKTSTPSGRQARWPGLDDETVTRQFVSDLFDLFRKNRGLVVMLWAADAQSGSELAETGVFEEITQELRVLVEIGVTERSRRQGSALPRQELVTRANPRNDRRNGGVRRIVLRQATTTEEGHRRGTHAGPAPRTSAPLAEGVSARTAHHR